MAESILNLPQYQSAEAAREYLEALRWPDGAVCPHCGSVGDDHYQLKGSAHRPGLWKCKDCHSQFSVTVGTVFEDSKIPLHKWLQAAYLMCASKKGISSKQIERMLGVSYKTAWFMTHRIREAMTNRSGGLLGSGGQAVEVDETFWGNRKGVQQMAGGVTHKMKLVSLVERGGEKRSVVVPNVTGKTLKTVLQAHVSANARLMTDERTSYVPAGAHCASHEAVSHRQGEYFCAPDITTNSVESSFSLLKRGLIGTFHQVGEQHLERYAREFDFRWTYRAKAGFNDVQRMRTALKGAEGKRLTYRPPNRKEAEDVQQGTSQALTHDRVGLLPRTLQ